MKKKQLKIYFIFGFMYFSISRIIFALMITTTFLNVLEWLLDILFVVLSVLYFYRSQLKNSNKTQDIDEHQLSTLINSMVDFVCFKDGEGRWLETNKFGLELFQLQSVDYKGKTDTELAEYTEFYRDALIYCQEHSDKVAWENRAITRCEETIPMPGGSSKTFDTIKHPLFNSDGTRKGLVVIGRDITEKKLAEERLVRSEKLSVIGELAASVAHEIRNPLTSLKGFVQFIRPTNLKHDHYYEIMLSELDRINQIVSELLLLAKPQKINFSRVNLIKTIEHVISLLSTQANMNNVSIRFEADSDGEINGEENQIKQLLINVIKNAIEATANNGTVLVTLNQNSSHQVIMIKDSGVGIPLDSLSRLGEPFYSLKDKGTGLGLTVSLKIVEQHQGDIKFTSEHGKGTEVTISLPSLNTWPISVSSSSAV